MRCLWPSAATTCGSSRCLPHMIKNVLNIRFGTLWTAARATDQGTLYQSPALSLTANALTARLLPTHPATSWAHALIPPLHAAALPATTLVLYCRLPHPLCNCLRRAPLASQFCFTVMDATAKRDAPDTVYDTRLPAWLLPQVPDSTRAKMRPDILLVDGLPLASVRNLGVNKHLDSL